MSIITLSEVKSHIGIASSDEDAVLQRIVNGVEQAVRRWTRRRIDRYVGEVEYRSGSGMSRFYLRNRPVVSVSGVYVDQHGAYGQAAGAFPAETMLVHGEDWVLEDSSESESNFGCLIRLGAVWPVGGGNIKIVYDHGYSIAPADLRLGCLELCRVVYSSRKVGGPIESETLGDYSYKLMSSSSKDIRDAVNMIRPYREVSL